MKKGINQIYVFTLLAGMTVPVFAEHGPLSATQRDGWIDSSVSDLAAEGLVPRPGKPVSEITNLEVAQWTAHASQNLLDQADTAGVSPPALSSQAAESLKKLVKEFRDELAGMDVDLAKLDEQIYRQQHRDEYFTGLQGEYLKRTGTVINGYSRGYAYNFQGSGAPATVNGTVYPGPVYGPMTYNSDMFVEMDLKSIPVPYVLFDARLRYWRSVGMYYADPLGGETNLDMRWISLSYYNPVANLTAGDFYKNYTPLTLWNNEVPVYTFLEPTPLESERKDVEEIVFMDHGPYWHLRGFQAYTAGTWTHDPVISGMNLHVMAGSLTTPSDAQFGDDYAGSQVTLALFNGQAQLGAQGLLIWADPNSAAIPYLPDFPLNWAREYQVGSLSGGVSIPVNAGVTVGGSLEYAGSHYQDDMNNPGRSFRDWALLASGSVNFSRYSLSVKAFQIEPFFYSPGAQTNRYSTTPQNGYLSTNNNEDEFLIGYLNRFPFQGANRPTFAGYDRMLENAMPYGDATPNRQGILLGFSGDLGKDGWLKSQASCVADLREIQPNIVLSQDGSQSLAVDSQTNTAAARVFGGYELAFKADLAKLAELEGSTYQAGIDYKHQTTDLGLGASPFAVDTFIAALDFNPPLSGFDDLLGSVAFEMAQSSGSEFVLSGQGSPPTYASYPFYLDSSSLGAYSYLPLDILKTTWVLGLNYPLSPTVKLRGSYFIVHYTWTDVPDFDRWDKIWRFTYEASF